ncbi:MAG: hypothetical protein WBF58_16110 [Xanthobacteraceae bacterium]
MEPGPFLDLTTELAADPLLHTLAPISIGLQKRYEYEELVTRFFAFLNRYQKYGLGREGKVVKNFLLSYVQDTNDELQRDASLVPPMRDEWKQMLAFVHQHFPDGFKKTGRGRKVPRVRFEAIAVGIGLALRESATLTPLNLDWLESKEFKEWTTSDASNNRVNLIGRVEYVRDKLLGK